MSVTSELAMIIILLLLWQQLFLCMICIQIIVLWVHMNPFH